MTTPDSNSDDTQCKADNDIIQVKNNVGHSTEDDLPRDFQGILTVADNNSDDDAHNGIIKVDVDLPLDFKGKLAFVLEKVFTPEECQEYINITEKKGYEKALVNVGFGRQRLILDTRNNDRCIWDTFEESERIWKRIKKYVPSMWKRRQALGLNERLRFLRYHSGQYFKPHMDGEYVRDNGEKSFITVQLYLNEGFEGGETTFMSYSGKHLKPVVPKTGSVLVFQHDILHEGSELKKGVKYAVRTDVMFAAKEAL